MRLSKFIIAHMDEIMHEWEGFASTVNPPALTMDSKALQDHARLMLEAMALDLENDQSDRQQFQKSTGQGRLLLAESNAETHASGRLKSGFTMGQLFSEYRALRASVLKLWARADMNGPDVVRDMTRFNEAIDQAVAESIARYSSVVSTAQNMFLAILGHDLRNPLSTTLMAASFIEGSDDIDSHRVAASRIHSSATRMSNLVNDLLDYTRTHLGMSLPISRKPADLRQICEMVVAEQQIAHPGRQINFLADGNSPGQWDPERIAQVLSNLLGNAVQYGDPTEPIVLRVETGSESVALSVENKGPVIPSDKIESLFDPMVRLSKNPEAERTTSLGIGLYIAREIVEAHGGEISANSSAEEGTVFAVTLPRTL